MVTKPRKPQFRHTETDPPLASGIDSKFKKNRRMVLFVHGIRDPGFWEQDLRKLFEAEGFIAKPIGYHVFDIFRFLLGFRRRAVEWVKSQIESAVHDNPDAELTIIAHSFGTYVVARILEEDPNVRLSRLVMCGGIVRRRYRWDKTVRLNGQDRRLEILNEHSARDIWPVFARHATLGFGDTGTIGCQNANVTDRQHAVSHSKYLNKVFAKDYWIPHLAHGKDIKFPDVPESRPWYFLLNRSPVTMLVLLASLVSIFVAYWSYDRFAFRTRGTLEYNKEAGVTFEVTGIRNIQRKAREPIYSAQNVAVKTRHEIFSEGKFNIIEIAIKNRILIRCNTQSLEDSETDLTRDESHQTLYEFDLSHAYKMFGSAELSFQYESNVKDGEQEFDRLTLLAGDGIDPGRIKLLDVTHTDDDCLDDMYKKTPPTPFVAIAPLSDAQPGVLSSLFPWALAGLSYQKIDKKEIVDFLNSDDLKLRNLGIETIIASPDDYTDSVRSIINSRNSSEDAVASAILAARNAIPTPINLDIGRLVELAYGDSNKVRDAARSYLRSPNVVNDNVAEAIKLITVKKLAELRNQRVNGRDYGRDYLLLITARDVLYNLGLKKLQAYLDQLRKDGSADFQPVLATFDAGRDLRRLAANDDQKVALSKSSYGKAYALWEAAVNQQALREAQKESPFDFITRAANNNLPLSDTRAAKEFRIFLSEIEGRNNLYPWPVHIQQAKSCADKLTFGCLGSDKQKTE